MTLTWIATLLIYQMFTGWHALPAISLLLLVPMVMQDTYDIGRRRK